jgi:hypothetical protein
MWAIPRASRTIPALLLNPGNSIVAPAAVWYSAVAQRKENNVLFD